MNKTIIANDSGIMGSLKRIFGADVADFVIPELYFSDAEPPKESYGELDKESVRNKLKELEREYVEKHPEGPDYIYPLTGEEARSFLFDRMSSVQYEYPWWVKDLMKKVKEILEKEKGYFIVAGVYDSSKNEITIYSQAFEALDAGDYEAAIRRTIAHELFHAFHHFAASKTFSEYTYEAEVVREALADFYSYVACLDGQAITEDGISHFCSENVANERYHFWKDNLFVDIPYPNAIFHMFRGGQIYFDKEYVDCLNNGAVDKMTKILELSKTDMHNAYLELVPEEFRKKPTKKYTRNRVRRTLIPGVNVVIKVKLGYREYSYLFDPQDEYVINVGDEVICMNRNASQSVGVVTEVQDMTDDDYRELCNKIGYPDLAIAKWKP